MILRIRVIDKEDDKPLPFIFVRLHAMEDIYTQKTNREGLAEFPHLKEGYYVLEIAPKFYRPYNEKHYIMPNQELVVLIEQAVI